MKPSCLCSHFFSYLYFFCLSVVIHCLYLVPFWTSCLHVPAARRIQRTVPGMIRRSHWGTLTLPRAAFRERSLVLCQVSMCGAASQRYVPSVTQMSYLTFILVDWGLMMNPNERPTETISCNIHHRGNPIQMFLFAFGCSDVLRRIARHARTG